MQSNKPTLYRHYKNKLYKYLGLTKHSETLEDLVLYQPLENNPSKDLWVRPKDNFFSTVEIDGLNKLRFEPVQFKYLSLKNPDDRIKQDLILLAQSIFKTFDQSQFEMNLNDKKNILILAAFDDEKLIGFKMGFELNNTTFYSWLGGIDEKYRGFGIGKELIKEQHLWCETMGYKFIETKTMNSWKTMLILNLNHGFKITGTELSRNLELKILLRKDL